MHDRGIDMTRFLAHSIQSLSTTSVPFLRAAYARPEEAATLDDTFDANTPCQVARRSSVAQGRALLKLVDKTFLQHCADDDEQLFLAVKKYKMAVQSTAQSAFGHFGVVFGIAGRVLKIDLERLVQVFLQSHAKAVLSAAVRLSLIGPYESTHILCSKATQNTIRHAMSETRNMDVSECGQSYSLIDIWQGRHELLYSRIFSA